MSREAMQMALEALESDPISHTGLVNRKQAITALRQALVDADDISEKRVDEKAKREHEPVAWADRIIDDLAELFDKDRIREADSGDALIRLHEAIAVVEEASKLYNKQPAKIFGPSLEEILNSAGFYRKREWISLTDGEIDILSCEMVKGDKSVNWLCKVLEAKLKEKNT
jgi:hypothetical protein